ncbi:MULTISPECIES: TniQ family protein [Bosea]|uniref:TniQ protein n=1 Tax=Bosea robiniae TaxID=1036780 RepID=A0ABY0P5R9_9HYPH|nr:MULTISPECIES: TniQ family protein [Bosea]TQI72415.1 TniQ protein [Bosea sp. AK1]SDH32325.1 TniQ protein [Bosea robiniae]
MSDLYPSLPLRTGESPASFVSRLALLHRAQSQNVFALDMGFELQAVVDGDTTALTRLARISGASLEQLFDNAIVRHEDHYLYRGHKFARASLRRARVMACPQCLTEDIAGGCDPWLASGRSDWLFQHYRICLKHCVELVELGDASDPHPTHDFARRTASHIASIPALARQASPSDATKLERYLAARLGGHAGPEWLDTLPCYVAWRTCEVIGAVDLNGRDAPMRDLSEADWRRAGDRGYAIAASGKSGVREFLNALRATGDHGREGSAGPQARFGQFFKWLYSMKSDPNYDPVRNLVIDFVADTAPVAPDEMIFGRQIVPERRRHSIHSASRESGIHHKRLRRVLSAAGVLPPDSLHLTANVVTFPVAASAPIVDLLQNLITLKQAETYLNAGRVHTKLLAAHGFVEPVEGHERLELGDQRYDRRQLDEFMKRLFANVVWVKEPEWPQMTIAEAAKRTCCSAMEIVRLILDHQLRWVGSWTATTGYQSVLVDVTEVKKLIHREDGDHLTIRQAAEFLGTTDRVVSALVERLLLSSESRISPKNRCPYLAVPRKAAEAFKSQFASLHELARSRGKHMPILKRELATRGIEPALRQEQAVASFYLRSVIPPDL